MTEGTPKPTDDGHEFKPLIVPEIIGETRFRSSLGNIYDRLSDADMLGMMPDKGSPTPIAREEYFARMEMIGYLMEQTDYVYWYALANGQRVDTKRGAFYRFGPKTSQVDVINLDDHASNKALAGAQIKIRKKLREGTVNFLTSKDYLDFNIRVNFPKDPEDPKQLHYNSGMLAPDSLTTEDLAIASFAVAQISKEMTHHLMNKPPQS